MDIVTSSGLRPIINAVGTATRVGGQRMHPEVIAAMADAAGRHFAIDELQEIAGREIAAATGAESGYVTAGASAGLLLGTAAVHRWPRSRPHRPAARHRRDAQRDHRPARPPQRLRPRAPDGRREDRRGRLRGPPGRRADPRLADRGGDRAADRGDRAPGAVRAGNRAAPRGRGDRAPARAPRDRGRGRGPAAQGEPAPVHRRGRGPRRVLGRQGDRRAAGVRASSRAAPI